MEVFWNKKIFDSLTEITGVKKIEEFMFNIVNLVKYFNKHQDLYGNLKNLDNIKNMASLHLINFDIEKPFEPSTSKFDPEYSLLNMERVTAAMEKAEAKNKAKDERAAYEAAYEAVREAEERKINERIALAKKEKDNKKLEKDTAERKETEKYNDYFNPRIVLDENIKEDCTPHYEKNESPTAEQRFAFKFYSNKIDALINQIKNILQSDRDDPIIAEVINNTSNFVRLKIYKSFLIKYCLFDEPGNRPQTKVNVLKNGVTKERLRKASTLGELNNLIIRDDIFNGEQHNYFMDIREIVAKVAAAKAFKHVHPDKGLDEMNFVLAENEKDYRCQVDPKKEKKKRTEAYVIQKKMEIDEKFYKHMEKNIEKFTNDINADYQELDKDDNVIEGNVVLSNYWDQQAKNHRNIIFSTIVNNVRKELNKTSDVYSKIIQDNINKLKVLTTIKSNIEIIEKNKKYIEKHESSSQTGGGPATSEAEAEVDPKAKAEAEAEKTEAEAEKAIQEAAYVELHSYWFGKGILTDDEKKIYTYLKKMISDKSKIISNFTKYYKNIQDYARDLSKHHGKKVKLPSEFSKFVRNAVVIAHHVKVINDIYQQSIQVIEDRSKLDEDAVNAAKNILVEDAKKEFDKAKTEKDNNMVKYNNELTKAQTEVVEANNKVEKAKTEKDNNMDKYNNELTKAQTEVVEAKNKVEEAKKKVNEALDEVEAAKDEVEAAKDEVKEAANKKLDDANATKTDADNALGNAEKKVVEANNKVEKAKTEKDNNMDKYNNELTKAQTEVVEAKNKVEEAKKKVNEAEKKVEDAENKAIYSVIHAYITDKNDPALVSLSMLDKVKKKLISVRHYLTEQNQTINDLNAQLKERQSKSRSTLKNTTPFNLAEQLRVVKTQIEKLGSKKIMYECFINILEKVPKFNEILSKNRKEWEERCNDNKKKLKSQEEKDLAKQVKWNSGDNELVERVRNITNNENLRNEHNYKTFIIIDIQKALQKVREYLIQSYRVIYLSPHGQRSNAPDAPILSDDDRKAADILYKEHIKLNNTNIRIAQERIKKLQTDTGEFFNENGIVVKKILKGDGLDIINQKILDSKTRIKKTGEAFNKVMQNLTEFPAKVKKIGETLEQDTNLDIIKTFKDDVGKIAENLNTDVNTKLKEVANDLTLHDIRDIDPNDDTTEKFVELFFNDEHKISTGVGGPDLHDYIELNNTINYFNNEGTNVAENINWNLDLNFKIEVPDMPDFSVIVDGLSTIMNAMGALGNFLFGWVEVLE